jgi:predicted transcriptional regulator
VSLDDRSIAGLLPVLARYENRRMSLEKLVECLNDAAHGVDVHEAVLNATDRALRLVKAEGGLTTSEIAARIGAGSGAVQLALYKARQKGLVRSEGTRPLHWYWRKR